jgi:hypothetical protein
MRDNRQYRNPPESQAKGSRDTASMSRANVEVVQAALDAWNAGDMDAFGALHDPDVIWAGLEGWPEAETLVGREACMSQYERMRAAFDVDTVDPTPISSLPATELW